MLKSHTLLRNTAAFSMLASASYVNADYTSTETQTNITTSVVTTSNPPGPPAIIPSGRSQVKDGVDLFLTADWLIWQANSSGLGFVIEDSTPNTTVINSGHVKNPGFKYEFGFKVGLGCNLSHDGWDALLSWTWFHDKARRSVSNAVGTSTLFTTFISPTSVAANNVDGPAFTQSASSSWKLHLDVLDLEMGREFYAGKWLTLRPYFGLRSGWINQKYQVDYSNVSTFFAPTTVVYSSYDSHMTNDYWGFGPRVGMDGHWGFGGGWSLYGNAGISLLYGFFHVSLDEESTSLTDVTTTRKNVRDSFHSSKAVTDLEIGLQWDYMFFNDSFHIGVHAGWEHHMFFSQNQFMRFSNSVEQGQFFQNQGDLAFQGWSVGARFDF